jgi:phage tail sheath protein FI
MANVYKTPGVYVEEISLLPPSVAEVETAIPAFIGHTEFAEKNGIQLKMVPTAISSMIEYHQYFGGAPACTPTVTLDENNTVVSVDAGKNKYYMYDSLQLFFSNGGGKCYIISVGNYKDKVELGDAATNTGLKGGLKQLEKEDEPTLIVSPDAVLLSGTTDLYDFQKLAISQCAMLQDRFAVCDLKKDVDSSTTPDKEFRDNIGINDLKYAAAYTPWLKANLSKNISYKNITLKRAVSDESLQLENLTKDQNIKSFIVDNLKVATKINKDIEDKIVNAYPGQTIKDKFGSLLNTLENGKKYADVDKFQTNLRNIYAYLRDLLYVMVTDIYAEVPNTDSFKFLPYLDTLIKNNNLHNVFKTLVYHSNAAIGFKADKIFLTIDDATIPVVGDDINKTKAVITSLNTIFGIAKTKPEAIKFDSSDGTIDALYTAEADVNKKADIAKNAAVSAFASINVAINDFIYTAQSYESTFNKNLSDIFGLYKTIVGKITDCLNVVPPSGAIVGIYAYVDANRGVWKAPANVSLNSVIGPVELINNKQQEDLNVDPNAGKSINAIRTFAGKGTLIWGARTLAGNDNEWRYIPVRRFYNFAEESIKKGTGWVVFEPNDANTWIRVKAMIENFLTKQWRNGALAGAKPEDAFFVKVGLGQTMTSLDILEGRMNIEIGMAVVRPAEFIILKFSHLLQKS